MTEQGNQRSGDGTLIGKAGALAKVADEIERCEVCRRDKIGKAVPGEGNPQAKTMFVGEVPGKREAVTGRPFVAQSGRVLDRLLRETGLNRSDVFITSPVKYLPRRGTPTVSDIEHGRTHLLQQIAIIDPRLVVLMGRVAARAVLGEDIPITKEHGGVVERDGRKYFLTFHPAAVLHNPALDTDLGQDTRKLRKLVQDL